MSRRAKVENRLPQHFRCFGRGQTRNRLRHQLECPVVKVARQSVDLFSRWRAHSGERMEHDSENFPNEAQPCEPLVGGLGEAKVGPSERGFHHVRVEAQTFLIQNLARPSPTANTSAVAALPSRRAWKPLL